MSCRDCKYCYRAYNRNSGLTDKYFCVFPAMEGVTFEDVGDVIAVLFKKDLDSSTECESYKKKED